MDFSISRVVQLSPLILDNQISTKRNHIFIIYPLYSYPTAPGNYLWIWLYGFFIYGLTAYTFHINGIITCSFLALKYVFEVLPHCSIYQYFTFLYCWIMFHRYRISMLIHSSTDDGHLVCFDFWLLWTFACMFSYFLIYMPRNITAGGLW